MAKLVLDDLRDYLAAWHPEVVAHVLEGMDRVGNRSHGPQAAQNRRTDRRAYSAVVIVLQHRAVRLKDGTRAKLPVIARNLSRSGLGLLTPLVFEPAIACLEAPALQSQNVFREGAVLEIGLPKENDQTLWVSATVVRARIVQHDFLDVGVRFNARNSILEELESGH